jgi:hypothetical protein
MPDSNAIDALVLAAIGTGSLLLVTRGLGRFQMKGDTRLWMGLVWLLLFVGTVLIYRAFRT